MRYERTDANSKDMLSRIHEQRVKDQNNDSTKPVRSPWSRPRSESHLMRKSHEPDCIPAFWSRYLCALLGFGYVIQINNTTSTYETMSEDELTKLISETNAQVQKLEQRKNELSSQLNALKDTADQK